MFQFNIEVVPYSDPWNIQLPERIKTLASGKRRVAYFYEAANNSTFRYRAYNMVNVLNNLKNYNISASYFFLNDLHRIDEIVDYADILVVCRSGYSHRINQLIMRFLAKKKPVLFDIDDLVFNTSYAHLIMNTLGVNVDQSEIWDYWFAYIGRMGETLRICDGVITTNGYLANKLNEFSGLPVNVVPNFINKEQLDISQLIFRNKLELGFLRDDKVTLGYFSGSPSHNLDYAMILSAIEAVMDEDDRVELMIVGYIDAGSALRKFGDRIKIRPFMDYINLQRLIGRVEYNLMPLQFNDFTNCKSELKYFEAAIVGTLSIASPSVTYSAAIEHGVNGYISKAHMWASTIKKAIANLDVYPEIVNSAFAHANSRYTYLNQEEPILKALGLD